VIPVRPEPSAAAKGPIDRPRDANREPPEPAAKRARVIGFDQEMEMVVLDTELNDPKPAVGGRDQGAPHGWEGPMGPQATDCLRSAQRDVYGVGGDVRRPAAVWDAGAAAGSGLPPGAGATATPTGAEAAERAPS
jgi:hypothetical protein